MAALHAQESTQGDTRARRPDEKAYTNQDECDKRECQGLNLWVGESLLSPLNDRKRELTGEDEQHDGDERADQPRQDPLEHKRAPDKPVCGTYKLHHLDLAPSCEDR